MSSKEKFLSIVVPLNNEEGNVERLHREIMDTLQKNDLRAEVIFVDDGSTDKTLEKLENLRPLKTIIFRKNFGQTAALDAGIKASKGETIITMDGDLQNDPADIPNLLDKLNEGYDVVSGWRKKRKDSTSKRFTSRGADFLRKFLINDQIHDSGCTLKAYRKECFDSIDLYGEMHRFIPGVLKIQGFKIGEVVVNHRPRTEGVTKYNYKRVGKSLLDMVSVWFWRKFFNRPLHLFGGMGSTLTFLGIAILVWMFIDRLFFGNPIGNRIWPIVGIFMILMGVQLFISGLLADINIKTYHQAKKETPYNIKEIRVNDRF